MPEFPDAIARINALTTNARNTWFALLGVLVFVGITLMGVEHIDFYGVDRATQLPLVNVEVPTRFFFVAAPILTAAIFGYFHLYLIRLWDALSNAPSRAGGQRLGDAVPPWLVTDAALHLRHVLRRDYCTTPRALDWTSTLLTFALNWGLGLALMGAIWWMSMPARDIYMTGIAAACTLACLFIGGESALQFYRRMKEPGGATGLILDARLPHPVKALAFVLSVAVLGFVTYARTHEPPEGLALFGQPDRDRAARWLAPVAMPNEAIAQRPPGWLPYQEARLDYLATWCGREGLTCTSSDPFPDGFAAAWKIRRDAAIAEQLKPHWHKSVQKPNWTDANLAGTYLTGVNLSGAQMQRANLMGAQMEGADLSGARMEGADLWRARMEGATLIGARMEGANLSGARMEGANLSEARMEGADLWRARMEGATLSLARMEGATLIGARMEGATLIGARMEGATLSGARMEGATLIGARMEGATLIGARMEGANLSLARMEGANLSRARMEGANLSRALLTGTPDQPSLLRQTNLSAAVNDGGALRFVDLTRIGFDAATDFRNAFLDGSVRYTDAFARQMGGALDRPCQWWPEPLPDAEFFGRWRGWVEHGSSPIKVWRTFAPEDWRDVPAIPPPDGCEWKTGPMPGAKVNE